MFHLLLPIQTHFTLDFQPPLLFASNEGRNRASFTVSDLLNLDCEDHPSHYSDYVSS